MFLNERPPAGFAAQGKTAFAKSLGGTSTRNNLSQYSPHRRREAVHCFLSFAAQLLLRPRLFPNGCRQVRLRSRCNPFGRAKALSLLLRKVPGRACPF